jgi:hypothetical protein
MQTIGIAAVIGTKNLELRLKSQAEICPVWGYKRREHSRKNLPSPDEQSWF